MANECTSLKNTNLKTVNHTAVKTSFVTFLVVLFVLTQKVPKKSSTHDNTAHACTRLDWTAGMSFLQQVEP